MTNETITTVPFDGFYESLWSDLIDSTLEHEAEHFAGEYQQQQYGTELDIEPHEVHDLFYKHMKFSKGHEAIAVDYVHAFSELFASETGVDLGLRLESIESPREYNFATDQLFAHISKDAVQELFKLSTDNLEEFEAAIKARHSHRSGFISFYTDDLNDWIERDPSELDHNEIATLIQVAMDVYFDEDWKWTIYYDLSDNSYEYYSQSLDGASFYTDYEKLRDEKMAELDEDFVPPYRCSETPDMFTID